MSDPYLHQQPAAAYLAVSTRTIRRWESDPDSGLRPTRASSGEVLHRRSALDRFMRRHAKDPHLLGAATVSERYIRAGDAASILADEGVRVTVSTLAAWRDRFRGPLFYRVSRTCVRYRESDLRRWARWVRGELRLDQENRSAA